MFPLNDFDCYAGVLCDERLLLLKLGGHLFELAEALFELLASGRVLSACCDQLYRVESSLLVQIEEQLDNLVGLVQIVDLNFAFFQLG